MDATAIRRAFDPAVRERFETLVAEQADRVATDMASGRLDADCYAVGCELEAYAVEPDGALATVPDATFDEAGCAKELGLHNVELNTPATRFDAPGLATQADEIDARVGRTAAALGRADRRLALDAMWAIPPAGGTDAYLGAVREVDGLTVAERMRSSPRYHALDNEVLERGGGGIDLSLPGVDRRLDTILVESLATSIQPHLQVPRVADLPRVHDLAVRTMGPLLALAANSPFLPADWYDADDAEAVEAGYHELRIPVFEQGINAGRPPGEGNVRVPEDLGEPAAVPERVVADPTYAPVLSDDEDGDGEPGRYRDLIPEYDHKRGVHWRWVRVVVGGEPVGTPDGGSVRIEYRPLPTQPTVADNVSLLATTVGLLRGLAVTDHPLCELPWAAARDAFYRAVRAGPAADLDWVTADGTRTGDRERVYDDLFANARRGLADAGLDAGRIDDLLAPIERRRETGPPSAWKRARARAALADGATAPEAVARAQRAYLDRAGGDRPFADW
jgi:hypothetical protein